MAGVEDRGRERVEASHHEIGGRVLWLLDHVGDLSVVVRITDAVPTRLLPGHLLNQKRRIRAVLALAPHHVLQVRVEDVVAEDGHEVVVDVLLGGQQRVGQSVLLALVGVGDRHPVELVAVMGDDRLLHVADHHDELVRIEFRHLLETVGQDGLAVDLDHPLRFVLGQPPNRVPSPAASATAFILLRSGPAPKIPAVSAPSFRGSCLVKRLRPGLSCWTET